jgi:hypothetical protein
MNSGDLDTYDSNSFTRAIAGLEAAILAQNALDANDAAQGLLAFSRGWNEELDCLHVPGLYRGFTAGDDALENLPDLAPYFLKLGMVMTDYQRQTPLTGFDFCSTHFGVVKRTLAGGKHVFYDDCYQQNIDKAHVAILYKGSFDPQDQVSFRSNFLNHPRYNQCIALLNSRFGTFLPYRTEADRLVVDVKRRSVCTSSVKPVVGTPAKITYETADAEKGKERG